MRIGIEELIMMNSSRIQVVLKIAAVDRRWKSACGLRKSQRIEHNNKILLGIVGSINLKEWVV